jgi:hypothetical protein
MDLRRAALSALATTTLVLGTGAVGAAAHAGAPDATKKAAKRADLVVKDVNATLTGRTVTFAAEVVNKASKKKGKKAGASTLGVVLSTDTAASTNDTALASVAVGKLKPKAAQKVAGTATVPTSVAAGTYYVVACADSGSAVKEKKEQNNCSASGPVVIAATPPAATVTITYASANPLVGSVSATATNGTCTADVVTGGGACTVTAGVGTVVLTATNSPVPFGTWTNGANGPCDGAKSANTVTFTAPTANKSCAAVFGA